ncbi:MULTISPECIES: hypothetical protein [unclassified Bradyrhizobium]|nr:MULTISPECIES: hypothetical protein [unclassified Bradyrhizobium]
MLQDPAYETAENDGVRCENLAEVLALVVAQARDAGSDEVLLAEIVLRVSGLHRDDLLDARAILAPLGYTDIAALLRRLARSAPRRLTWKERMKLDAADRREARATSS